jgi:fructokinase
VLAGKLVSRIGIDLGGTKIEGLMLDAAGREQARRRIATPRGDYVAIVRVIAGLVRQLEADGGLASGEQATVGIGIPGAISPATGLIKNSNTTELIGHPFDVDLAAALQRPVRLENDANCFALSEAVDGAGKGAGVVFGVILGTGVGGGLVVNGQIVPGRHRITGEWGHNPLPWPSAEEIATAPVCYCGRAGCIETWASGPGLARDHERHTGKVMSAEEILGDLANADAAMASYRRYLSRLARGLAHLVNIIDPDAIVLGGGMGQIGQLYRDLPDAMRPHVFSDHFTTPVLPPLHGDASGVRGAAWLWGGI